MIKCATLTSILGLSAALTSLTPAAVYAAEEIAIEDIVVTATKRSERLKDVPISMSAISAEQLDQTGVRDLKSIAEYIPNLQISQSNDFRSTVTIRGVGAQSRNIGFDARVGVYVDGVYMGQSPSLNQELLDLERVEVLRGPQGTLFGKNTVAGAISLVTKKPGDEISGQVSADFGNLGYREFKGMVNLPVSEKVSTKFSVAKTDRDGYINNIVTGNDLMEIDTLAYRAQIRVQVSDQLEVNASFDGLNSESLILIGEPLTDMLGITTVPLAPEERVVAFSADPTDKRDIYGGHLDISYETSGGFTIKSITGYRETDASYTNVTDYAHLDIVSIEYADKYKQFSEEVQFISPDGQDFTYMVGLYYYDQKADTQRDVILGQDFLTSYIGLLTGADAVGQEVIRQTLGFGSPGDLVYNSGTVNTKSYAAYFNGGYQISDKLKLGLGLRYSIEDKDVNWLLDGRNSGHPLPFAHPLNALAFNIGSTGSDPSNPSPLINDRQDKFFAPAVSLTYALTDEANIYGKYSSGYKSGGFNLDYINADELAENTGLEFDKETVDSFEIGYKASYFDNKVTLNMAAFIANYDDYQVNQFVDLGGGKTSIRITNAAKVKTKGIEAEATWRATENLTFTGSMGVLDATFDEFLEGGSGGSDVSGNRLPNATTFNAAFSAQYYQQIDSLNSTLLIRADLTHRSDYYTTVNNDTTAPLRAGGTVPFDRIEPLTLINGRIGLISNNETWEVYLWGRNLTNQKKYVDDLRDFFGTISRFPNQPRTYGIEAVFNF
ncbi:TonB-dependent receptor [Paremcibacter congregatus]|uniref:TonB-dependent receptor n=1 Tax=Paremcibacter congregatus TaxID=2043170 RepID=A0A2G4YLR8_9PROT|nr:TonB-dependent receptor [Paremcibacter congregatus]PHZ83250.1 TonB-dependent receptor [Paremcibacter congregatus]QDE28277.1 TonB-dependent receptor [Paremcibacter congregatus]